MKPLDDKIAEFDQPAPAVAVSPANATQVAAHSAERIVFCRHSTRRLKRWRIAESLAQQAIIFPIALGGVGIGMVTYRVFASSTATIAAIAGYTVALIAPLFWLLVREFRSLDADTVERPDPDVRLNCVCHPQSILRHGELQDVAFEPQVFRPFLASSLPWTRWLLVAAISVVTFLVLVLTLYVLIGGGPYVGQGAGGAAVAAGVATAMFLWPTYYRVVPGRLDVMEFSSLGRIPVRVTRYDLADAWLEIDLIRDVVVIGHYDERGEPYTDAELSVGMMRRRTEFAHALLLAAISTHEAPPLPDDALLG